MINNFKIFLSENLQFLVLKLSIYLNRCVFVTMRLQEYMESKGPDQAVPLIVCLC